MLKDKLYINDLLAHFKSAVNFETKDILAFYKNNDPDIDQAIVNWRIYSLVKRGLINRIGRGKFSVVKGKNFLPEISLDMKTIYIQLKKEFPYLKICIWHTSVLNEFMLHQPYRFYLLIETEKVAEQSVFYFLKESRYSVFIDPTIDILDKYLPSGKEAIIIRSLVSEAPTQNVEGIITASLEKMLVDVFCDDVIFLAQQGAEMRTLFNEAITKYTVNENRMLRYADRRGKKELFARYLHSITNLRHE